MNGKEKCAKFIIFFLLGNNETHAHIERKQTTYRKMMMMKVIMISGNITQSNITM